MLAENFEKLFRKKINDTNKAAKAARTALGWEYTYPAYIRHLPLYQPSTRRAQLFLVFSHTHRSSRRCPRVNPPAVYQISVNV